MSKRNTIDLGNRYRNAFGLTGGGEASLKKVGNFYVTSDGLFESVTIKGNGFDLLFADMMGINPSVGNVFAPPPLVTFDRQKNITETPIDDSDEDPTNDAVVVERYNSGQWDVKIQGLLIDMDNHQFPLDKLIQLGQVFDLNDSFAVEGKWFDALNIHTIYIKGISITGVQGFEDTISFNLDAKSIRPVEYFLKNK